MKFENALRRTFSLELVFEGAPEQVFPLLCPVREYDWIDGWSCEMVYSKSGIAERGAVFRTRFPDLGEELWTIARYEPGRAIEFVRVAPGLVVVTLDIALEPEAARTRARWTHTYTAIGAAGAQLIAEMTEARHEAETRPLETMANHYLRTGKKLPRPAEARPVRR